MDLVVGVGNTLRTDDAAGVRLVESLPLHQGADSLTVHQLTPDLVERLAEARRVLFVDADAAGGDAHLRPLVAPASGVRLGHAVSPENLLALAAGMCGTHPEAWLLSVPAHSFDFGEGLSPEAEGALPRARELALAWLARGSGSGGNEEDE